MRPEANKAMVFELAASKLHVAGRMDDAIDAVQSLADGVGITNVAADDLHVEALQRPRIGRGPR